MNSVSLSNLFLPLKLHKRCDFSPVKLQLEYLTETKRSGAACRLISRFLVRIQGSHAHYWTIYKKTLSSLLHCSVLCSDTQSNTMKNVFLLLLTTIKKNMGRISQTKSRRVIVHLTYKGKVVRHKAKGEKYLKGWCIFLFGSDMRFLATFLWFKSRSLNVMCWRMQKLGH